MNNQHVVKAQRRRRSEIEQIVGQYSTSGLSRSEFCRQHHLTLSTLNRHLQRQQPARIVDAGRLLAVEVSPASGVVAGTGLNVLLSNGRRIEINTGFDGATLERLLSLLEHI
jgi:hypothetical protein